MNILWLCNIVLPELSEEFGFGSVENMGGWISSLWDLLKMSREYNLHICVPIINPQRMKDGQVNSIKYYSFLRGDVTVCEESQKERFCEIIRAVNPDVIHIWGTEFPHTYMMLKAAEEMGCAEGTVVNIQGIIGYCADVLCLGLPKYVYREGTSLDNLRKEFSARSLIEECSLKNARNVSGRTEWDKNCIMEMNPDVRYYHCGEVLREEFYHAGKWNVDNCRRHTIFISQAGYPLKGFHYALESIGLLKEKFDDLQVFVAGPDISTSGDDYSQYIMKLIDDRKLNGVINFLGMIDAKQMIDHYLEANAFLSASLLENSSNSVCEAMMLGVPVVSSDVGGMPSIVEEGKSGLMYSPSDTERCAELVGNIFDNDDLAKRMSDNELSKSNELNNREMIMDTISSIYRSVAGAK